MDKRDPNLVSGFLNYDQTCKQAARRFVWAHPRTSVFFHEALHVANTFYYAVYACALLVLCAVLTWLTPRVTLAALLVLRAALAVLLGRRPAPAARDDVPGVPDKKLKRIAQDLGALYVALYRVYDRFAQMREMSPAVFLVQALLSLGLLAVLFHYVPPVAVYIALTLLLGLLFPLVLYLREKDSKAKR